MEEFMNWLMLEGSVQHSAWFVYVTFHDIIQWLVLGVLGLTAWGKRKKEIKMEKLVKIMSKELQHVHDEIHIHLGEPFGEENEHNRVYRLANSVHEETRLS